MKRKTQLETLNKEDLSSLILFTLYKLKDDVGYATLSELAYILNREDFFNLLKHFGGMTIKIPTLQEFESVTYALQIYNAVNIKHVNLTTAIKELNIEQSFKVRDILKIYTIVCDLIDKYNFKRDEEDN